VLTDNSGSAATRHLLGGSQFDLFPAEAHALTGPQLCPLAAFDRTIHPHLSLLDCGMRRAPRVHQTRGLEQLVELDVVAPHCKLNCHVVSPVFLFPDLSRRTGARVRMAEFSPARSSMTSTPACPAPAPDCTLSPPLAANLVERADDVIQRALQSGALQPIRTEQGWLDDGAFRFSVRWVSSLALKDRARVDTVIRRRPDFNPFLPPEPELTVAELGAEHLVVLNKFPVIDRHLLIVTRKFEDQHAPLSNADFDALAAVIAPHGGLGFYNGGRTAGASQAHKHLQWVPETAGTLAPFLPAQQQPVIAKAITNPALPWAHALVGLAGIEATDGGPSGAALASAFRTACSALGLPCATDPMPPYNLLVTRETLLLVPRTQEKWQDVSINSLAYAGSLFVRDREQIEALRARGPLAVLSAVGRAPG